MRVKKIAASPRRSRKTAAVEAADAAYVAAAPENAAKLAAVDAALAPATLEEAQAFALQRSLAAQADALLSAPAAPAAPPAPALSSAYLETLRIVARLGGAQGNEVSLASLEEDRRASGRAISAATLLTHAYRMRTGKKGTPRVLANSKEGGRSNDNERFVILPSGFALLGLPVPAAHDRYEITETGFTVRK